MELSFKIYSDWLGNRISKFTFLYPFITDGVNKSKGEKLTLVTGIKSRLHNLPKITKHIYNFEMHSFY